MRGEFHIHTKCSDGLLELDEIMGKLKGNLDYFAITDHDYIDESIKAYYKAEDYNLKAIIGVEISSNLNGESIHILGYFKNDLYLDKIKNKTKDILSQRLKRLYIIKDRLKMYFDIDLDVEELKTYNSITRGSIARKIISQGYNYTIEDIFNNILGENCKAYYPSTNVSPQEIIDLIHECHGLAVLAHPVLLKKNKVEDLLRLNFDGLEAIYPLNKTDDELRFRKLAEEHNMFITAGTDFHYENDIKHGNLLSVGLFDEDLKIFIRKINELK